MVLVGAKAGGASGLEKPIGQPKVQRVGIALTGFVKNVEPDRIQLMGRTEIGYLKTLPEDDRITLLNSVFAVGFPAVVISAGLPALARGLPPRLPDPAVGRRPLPRGRPGAGSRGGLHERDAAPALRSRPVLHFRRPLP